MKEIGTFPFGWVRNLSEENWQILWDSATNTVFAKGAVSKKVISIGQSPSWQEAKVFADQLLDKPEVILKSSGNEK